MTLLGSVRYKNVIIYKYNSARTRIRVNVGQVNTVDYTYTYIRSEIVVWALYIGTYFTLRINIRSTIKSHKKKKTRIGLLRAHNIVCVYHQRNT